MALIAQNLFGGKILYVSLLDVPGFEHMHSHYWNKLADGSTDDFTKAQFGELYPIGLLKEANNARRPRMLSHARTVKRYKLLAFRLAKTLSGDNQIFANDIYRRCFYQALDSTCQKMKFGCVITHNGKIVYEGYNQKIDALKSLCEPKCIRLGITSRTESMLGACGHAEEQGLWQIVHDRLPTEECELYIAGIYPSGLPWLKKEPEHTCLRCAVQMHYAKIKLIYVPVIDHWEGITAEQALKTAKAYATQEKTIS